MRRALALVLLFALAGGAIVASAATPKKLEPMTYVAQSSGYRITIPKAWKVIPPSLPAIQKTIAQLKKKKQTELAAAYENYISTTAARSELKSYDFRAFAWPPGPTPVPFDVTVSIAPIPKGIKNGNLTAVGDFFAKNMRNAGATVQKPLLLKLPAGEAVEVTGAFPLPNDLKGLTMQYSLVALLRPRKVYLLQFRIDAAGTSAALIFPQIASLFRFCPAKGSCLKA